MAEKSDNKISSSPSEDFNPLAEDLYHHLGPLDLQEEDAYFDRGSPGSSLDQESLQSLEPGSLDRYAVTPPANIRAEKRFKERVRSSKQKQSYVKGFNVSRPRSRNTSGPLSTEAIGDVICDIDTDVSTSPTFDGSVSMTAEMMGAIKRKKDNSKPFKTSRSIDRDMKMSSGDLTSLDSSIPSQPIKIDTPNRFRSLHSKPVALAGLNTSSGDIHTHLQRRVTSYSNLECPQDRIEFYKTFSTLINLGNTEKKKKEDNVALQYNRQLSSEQEYYQNQLSDLLWLELQAYFSSRSMRDQDLYIIKARDIVPLVLEEILNFKVRLKEVEISETDCTKPLQTIEEQHSFPNCETEIDTTESENDKIIKLDINLSFDEGSKLYSAVVQDGSTDSSLDQSLKQFCDNSSATETCDTSSSLNHCIKNQKQALIQVSELLNKLERVQQLYPTSKALGKDNILFNKPSFQIRLNALCMWLNITKDIGNKLSLMATVLYVDNHPGIEWPWLDYESPNQIIQKIRDTSETITPVVCSNPHYGLRSDEENDEHHYGDGLSEDENENVCSQKKFHDGLSSDSGDDCNINDGLSSDESESDTPFAKEDSAGPVENKSCFLSETPNNKSAKNVRFSGIEITNNNDISPSESAANLIAYSPTETSTPKKDYLTPNRQISNSSTMSRTSSSMSFEESRTSIYRHFVDRHLKKMGLRKLLHRLKHLLDGTLQRARQALAKPRSVPKSQSVDMIVREPLSPETQVLSSSPSMDGLPNMPDILMQADTVDTYGSSFNEFQNMNLPSFKSTYLFLVRIPLDVVHECMRLRLEQRPETEPSLLSVKQLIRECKEVLLGACMVKQYYQFMVSSVLDEHEERSDIDLEQFEEDLRQILDVYFDYTQTWMSGLQRTSEMSKRLKTFLEDEWKFTKIVCPHVRGGDAKAGGRFCLMESSLLRSIADFLESGMDECINKLYDSTLLESLNVESLNESTDLTNHIYRHHSRSGEVRQAIIQTCRGFKETFHEARERASKALGFAKMLRKDLEIAADFNIQVTATELLDKLKQTNHIRVLAPYSSGYLMFIPDQIKADKKQILQLLNVTCGREDPSQQPEISQEGYLLLLKCDACLDQQKLCPHWTGKKIQVEPNADTTIALSHIEVEGLLLVVIANSLLKEMREKFMKLMKSEVQLVTEQTSCHQAIAGSLSELKNSAMELRDRVTDAITQVDMKLTIEDVADLEEAEKVNIQKLYKETLHQCYNFGFEYHREIIRIVSGDMGASLASALVQFAKQWMKFVTTKCERGRGVRPRWAKPGLDFLIVACEPNITALLSSEEFHELKEDINKCIMHVIGEKKFSHNSPGSRVGSPMPDPQRKSMLRNLSCPDTRPPTRSLSSRSTASDPATPSASSDMCFISSQPSLTYDTHLPNFTSTLSMRKNSTPSLTNRQNSDVEITEGEDGGIVLDIHQHIDPPHLEADEHSKIGTIRTSVHKLEQKRTNKLFEKKQIGRITQQKREVDYHIANKKVNFKWQRGIKIGEGNFGKVYTAVNMDTGELIAMKEIRFQPNDHQTIKEAAEEIKIFEELKHPSLVRYYGVEVHRDEMLIFMEYCAEGTIEEVAKQGLSEALIRKYSKEILTAICYLHEAGIVHRDIKGANIFLTSNGPLKLGDFGCAVKLKSHTTMPGEVNTLVGTTAFMAPEVITRNEREGTGRVSDIWSLGCVVIEMTSGKRPWHDLVNNFQIMYQVGTGGTPAIPQRLSHEGKDFLSHCLVHNPSNRWSADQLQDHPFVKIDTEEDGDEYSS